MEWNYPREAEKRTELQQELSEVLKSLGEQADGIVVVHQLLLC